MYKTTLSIDGMMCNMCEAHVNDAIRNNFKVKKVSSSHSDGKSEIISNDKLPEDKLKEVIGETGYTLNGIKTEEYEKKGLFSFK